MDAQDLCTVPGLVTPNLAYPRPKHLAPHTMADAGTSVTLRSAKEPNPVAVAGSERTTTYCIVYQWPVDADKRFATFRARLAAKGYCLHRTAADDGPVCFYVIRWGLARELSDLVPAAQFLDQFGGAHA